MVIFRRAVVHRYLSTGHFVHYLDRRMPPRNLHSPLFISIGVEQEQTLLVVDKKSIHSIIGQTPQQIDVLETERVHPASDQRRMRTIYHIARSLCVVVEVDAVCVSRPILVDCVGPLDEGVSSTESLINFKIFVSLPCVVEIANMLFLEFSQASSFWNFLA